MIKYILRRLLVLPVVMLLVTLIIFVLILQIPAEERVIVYLPTVNPHISDEEYERLVQITLERYGLDRPPMVQYVSWLKNLVKGDWGYSPSWRQPVLEGLLQRAPATLELTLFAMIPSVILAILLGSIAARRINRLPDHLVQAAAFVAWAFPPFVLALMLMNLLYAWLGWFPPERMSIWVGPIVNGEGFHTYTGLLTIDALLNGRLDVSFDALRHLVLPGLTLALAEWALLARIMRSSLLEVLRQDYITTARAKGVPEREVLNLHARRNALLPLISAGGVVTSTLITNVVVIEMVFNFSGIGRWAVKAFLSSEIPVTVGFAVFGCMATVLASLFADILYAVVDPRIRLFGEKRSVSQ